MRIAGGVLALCVLVPGRVAVGSSAQDSRPPIALVELFTSEGCSSCPPADALLARLAADAERTGLRVFPLSFHVDYWNQLGWTDRFSSAAFTQRQRGYVRSLDLRGAYTPQMIVNGNAQFVGSDGRAAQAALQKVLASRPPVALALSPTPHGRDVAVRCHVVDAPSGATLHVAWADARAVSAPDRGENDGRRLEHVNVVRDLKSVRLDAAPKADVDVRLTRPDVVDGAVVAWVQQGATGRVLGAARVRVAGR